ncbi:MAG TPA: Spy/CpxP family protein refolding chaperone [Rudaea sp.]|nr:Spy/CpxP family protein refolding chaperone [Rudaea sp.]
MHNSTSTAHATSRFFGRTGSKVAIVAAVLGGVALTVGAVAQNAATGGFHHGGHHGAQMANASPADVVAHIDLMLQHIYAETSATPAQQAQIAPLVQATATDLTQLHTQFHAEHAQMLVLLTADPIDRVALESARVAQLNVIDQASKEIVQLLADTAGVLTPEQRKALAEKLAAHLGASQG